MWWCGKAYFGVEKGWWWYLWCDGVVKPVMVLKKVGGGVENSN